MRRRTVLAAISALALVAPAAAFAGPATPEAMVRTLYGAYNTRRRNPLATFDLRTPRKARNWMTPELADLYIWGVTIHAPDEEVPAIDWDVFVDGNDYEISGLNVTVESQTDTAAVVRADFHNFDEAVVRLYDFVKTPSGWRIDNLRGPPTESAPQGFDLTRVLVEAKSAAETPKP
jgi:hypothetical protein